MRPSEFIRTLWCFLTNSHLPTLPLVDGSTLVSEFILDINTVLVAGGRADSQDSKYQKPDDEFFTEDTIECFNSWLEMNGLSNDYDAEKFDCDDFAINFWTWCRILYARQKEDTTAEAPLIGYCKSATQSHALNFAVTQSGLIFFDPRGGRVPQPGGIYWMQF